MPWGRLFLLGVLGGFILNVLVPRNSWWMLSNALILGYMLSHVRKEDMWQRKSDKNPPHADASSLGRKPAVSTRSEDPTTVTRASLRGRTQRVDTILQQPKKTWRDNPYVIVGFMALVFLPIVTEAAMPWLAIYVVALIAAVVGVYWKGRVDAVKLRATDEHMAGLVTWPVLAFDDGHRPVVSRSLAELQTTVGIGSGTVRAAFDVDERRISVWAVDGHSYLAVGQPDREWLDAELRQAVDAHGYSGVHGDESMAELVRLLSREGVVERPAPVDPSRSRSRRTSKDTPHTPGLID